MKNLKAIIFATMIFIFVCPIVALAYVGPGAGLSLIGSLIGMGVAIIAAIGAILFWPIRALIKHFKKKNIKKPDDKA